MRKLVCFPFNLNTKFLNIKKFELKKKKTCIRIECFVHIKRA